MEFLLLKSNVKHKTIAFGKVELEQFRHNSVDLTKFGVKS